MLRYLFAVASAVTTAEVASEGTFPEQGDQGVLLDFILVIFAKEFQSEPLFKADRVAV